MKRDAVAFVTAPQRSHLIAGDVLWTMTKGDGVARARRWMTRHGYELEVQIWTGPEAERREDLSWSQIFSAEDALADAALAKKTQLQSVGWIEDLDGLYQPVSSSTST